MSSAIITSKTTLFLKMARMTTDERNSRSARQTRKVGMDPWDGMDPDPALTLFIGVITLVKDLFELITSESQCM